MAERLPTISEIMTEIRAADEKPCEIRDDQSLWLTRALHASYGNDADGEFETLADEYAAKTNGSNLQQDIVIAFSRLPNGAADWVVSDLINYLAADPQFYELAHASLALSFPVTDGVVDDLFIRGNMQREVLTGIINNDAIWRSDMTFAQRLAERGLPIDRDGVAKLVASTQNVG